MFGAILKATNSSFRKYIAFCRSIYVKKVMKLLALYLNSPRTLFSHLFESSLECQTDWFKIRPNIWVHSICKDYQQTTKE